MARVSLAAPVSTIVGGKTAKALRDGLGIETIDDLLRHYPRRYIDPGELTDLDVLQVGEHVTVFAEVVSAVNRRMQQRRGTVELKARRISVDQERELVEAMAPDRQLVRPLLVVVPKSAGHADGHEQEAHAIEQEASGVVRP